MKLVLQLAVAAAALVAVLWAVLHPSLGVVTERPLAIAGLLLVGIGMIRHAQQARDAEAA